MKAIMKMLGMDMKPPGPSAQVIEAQERQSKQLDIQEARAEAAEKSERGRVLEGERKKRAARRARGGRGGMRLLLSSDRDNPQLGLSNTLG